jgi:hypothetical protein
MSLNVLSDLDSSLAASAPRLGFSSQLKFIDHTVGAAKTTT